VFLVFRVFPAERHEWALARKARKSPESPVGIPAGVPARSPAEGPVGQSRGQA
jgi:hypothetical protein